MRKKKLLEKIEQEGKFRSKDVGMLENKILNVHKRIDDFITDCLVECEKCGCLLRKDSAIKGQSEIRKRLKPDVNIDGYSRNVSTNGTWEYQYVEISIDEREKLLNNENNYEEYIYIPYYCKVHGSKK